MEVEKFEILDHVTDLKIRFFGKDKKELFLNAMIGMYEGAKYQSSFASASAKAPPSDKPSEDKSGGKKATAVPSEALNDSEKRMREGEAEKIKREIKVSSPDLSSLLVDFLSELLYLTETHQEIYQHLQFTKFNDPSTSSGQVKFEGILIGKKLKRIGVLIKGVTYHQLDIHKKEDGSWEATILFDI